MIYGAPLDWANMHAAIGLSPVLLVAPHRRALLLRTWCIMHAAWRLAKVNSSYRTMRLLLTRLGSGTAPRSAGRQRRERQHSNAVEPHDACDLDPPSQLMQPAHRLAARKVQCKASASTASTQCQPGRRLQGCLHMVAMAHLAARLLRAGPMAATAISTRRAMSRVSMASRRARSTCKQPCMHACGCMWAWPLSCQILPLKMALERSCRWQCM